MVHFIIENIPMNAHNFIDELSRASPSLEELESIGLPLDGALRIQGSYQCIARREPLSFPVAQNELTNLLSRWDASSLRVGMVSFLQVPIASARGVQVGFVEADLLVVSHASDEVIVVDFAAPSHLLWKAAATPHAFLEALVHASRVLAQRCVKRIAYDDFEAAQRVSAECASLAGGDAYRDFFVMLLGAEP